MRGPPNFSAPERHVESVQPVIEHSALFRGSDHIKGVAGNVDYRSAGDSNLRQNVAGVDVIGRQRGYAGIGIEKIDTPQRRGSWRIGVEGVDTVMLCRHDHDIMNSISRDRDLRQVQRLRVNISVNRKRIEPAETRRVHVVGREDRFDRVLTSAGIVVMISRYDCQARSGQRLGRHALRPCQRIGRGKEVVARYVAGTTSTRRRQLKDKEDHRKHNPDRKQLRAVARERRHPLPIVQREIDEHAQAETQDSQQRDRF